MYERAWIFGIMLLITILNSKNAAIELSHGVLQSSEKLFAQKKVQLWYKRYFLWFHFIKTVFFIEKKSSFVLWPPFFWKARQKLASIRLNNSPLNKRYSYFVAENVSTRIDIISANWKKIYICHVNCIWNIHVMLNIEIAQYAQEMHICFIQPY